MTAGESVEGIVNALDEEVSFTSLTPYTTLW
jgi:hypothetical protein